MSSSSPLGILQSFLLTLQLSAYVEDPAK
jgi:hypothetical protein